MRAALRNHSYAAGVSDNRVSERDLHFLEDRKAENERNLSTPKYFTTINTRTSMPPIHAPLKPENFRTLTSRKLSIPKYQVPTNLPELQHIKSLVTSDQHITETSSHTDSEQLSKSKSLELNEWINLLTRPVPRRPEYAEPIKCKTPLCHLSQPDFQKPSKGFFKHIDKKAVSREFTVHPEFVSEAVKLQYIQGLASNLPSSTDGP
ncbi:hypothetical protein EB796_006412 [Bugula neritina]|uniref:Uncharacterized protein n=1 Tax=Bugula neritina TaxID=10212 RepID=A0A7J7KAS5_BUGNE|nr:hypothetical protein EB796_006412 [Bugula neritina]